VYTQENQSAIVSARNEAAAQQIAKIKNNTKEAIANLVNYKSFLKLFLRYFINKHEMIPFLTLKVIRYFLINKFYLLKNPDLNLEKVLLRDLS
jgi:hypothetical protein